MAAKIFTATFADGTVKTRQTQGDYAYAYRVIITRAPAPAYRDFKAHAGRVDVEFGFSKRRDLAQKAAAAVVSGNAWVRPGAAPTAFAVEVVECVRTK